MTKNLDLALILKLFPECPRVEQQPSIDSIICEYLRQHDVEVKPVSSNVQPSAITNAAMGAMGADVLAANTHLTVQQRSVALQEWTSWKQWALSQPDFKDFKRKALEKSEAAQKRQDKWLLANQARIQVKVESYRLEEREEKLKDQQFAMTILAGGVALIFVISGAILVVDTLSPPPSTPTTTKSR